MTDSAAPPASTTAVLDRLVRYCRAVDRKDPSLVVIALDGARVRLRDHPPAGSIDEIVALYRAAFDASGRTRHIIGDVTVDASADEVLTYQATYLRYSLDGDLPALEAMGTYSGRFVIKDGRLLWLEQRIMSLQ